MANGQFGPGNPGRPHGSKNKSTRKADAAFDLVFDALQTDDKTKLEAWARDNLGDFYRLFAKKLTTSADSTNHVITESVSEEHARVIAEGFLESLRSGAGDGAVEPDRLHNDLSSGISGG